MSNNVSIVLDKKKYYQAMALCILGNFLWGFSYMLTRTAQQYAVPAVQLSCRFMVTFLVMSIMILFKPSLFRWKGKNMIHLVIIGLLMPAYYYLESSGVYYTNSSFASLALSLVPVLALVAAAFLLKEYPSRRQVIFSFFPVVGVILITLANSEMGAVTTFGIIILAVACVVSTINRILNRKWSSDFTAFERTYATFTAGTIVFTVVALITVKGDLSAYTNALKEPNFLIPTFLMGIFCSVVGNTLVNYSFIYLPVIKSASIGTISTITATVLGIVFLHEPINIMSVIGSILAIIGIWQVTKVVHAKKSSQEETSASGEIAAEETAQLQTADEAAAPQAAAAQTVKE